MATSRTKPAAAPTLGARNVRRAAASSVGAVVSTAASTPKPPTRATVSAIVPSYAHREFLPKRMLSITAQSRPPDELIVVDDGSQDGSAEWLRAWRSSIPVQMEFRPQASGNPFSTWSAGVARAQSDWLWIAESDDACQPEFLETLLHAARRFPNAALVFCQSQLVDESGRELGSFAEFTRSYHTEIWKHDFVLEGAAAAELLLARNTIPNVSACLISRRAWEAASGAETSLNLCGDWVTYARLLQHGALVFCAQPLNRYRQHANTQRARTAAAEYVRQSYLARATIARVHRLDEPTQEFARRQACEETLALLGANAAAWLPRFPQAARDAVLAFDPDFERRAHEPVARQCDHCDGFFDAQGTFTTENQRRLPVLYYDAWKSYTFRDGAGWVRFDPLARPGRVLIRSLAGLHPITGVPLWRVDAGTGFAGVTTGTGVQLTRTGDALELRCAHEDPQLFLAMRSEHPAARFDLVVEMFCPKE